MTETHYARDLEKRLKAAQEWAERLEREKPNDHTSIAKAWAHVRRLKAHLRSNFQ